ncbi:unnamed protein product [Cuscuta europaea]|uniref:TTF-type domain-containing protein n=1 Tax=Cuscuta europaea TaxID=41803 RepID=A0A9P0YIT1_CUSEU|nr:unnamed protein product [Cuscuta europaea]
MRFLHMLKSLKSKLYISNLELPPSFSIERDPGKRKQIHEYHVNIRDEVKRAYLNVGPYQPRMEAYPFKKIGAQKRSFQKHWFDKFNWLEYSPVTDKAYCFFCFLFLSDIHMHTTSALVKDGFQSWKRINQGSQCAFLQHVGTKKKSPHVMCVERAENLRQPSGHIKNVLHTQSQQE